VDYAKQEEMILYLVAHLCLVVFNLTNVWIDAYRITKHKTIAHGINLGVYAVFAGLLCWWSGWGVWEIIIFCVSAFCTRQFAFDIPLSLRRGKKWDYVSTANPPKSILDRIEIRLFGYNGRAPFVLYGAAWGGCLIVKIILCHYHL
jgi:hypothetical protein